jgi:hypothetical protein
LDIRLSGEGMKVLARARARARPLARSRARTLADGRVCVPGVRSCAGCRVVDHSGVSSTGRATF